MSTALFESIARIARHEASARATAGLGRVVDVFTSSGPQGDHAVTVKMRDSGLVLPRVPVAVGVVGFAAIPAVGDLVLVVFTEGDINAPVVVGRLYNADDPPPEHGEDEIILRLPSGGGEPEFDFKLAAAEPSVTLKLPGDVKIEIAEGKVEIEVGAIRLSADSSGGGRAEVAAGGSSIVIKQDGDVTLTSANKLKLEGTEVEISGSARVKIQGTQVEIN